MSGYWYSSPGRLEPVDWREAWKSEPQVFTHVPGTEHRAARDWQRHAAAPPASHSTRHHYQEAAA